MQTIVVTYQEKTASFSVRVIARIVTGLEIQHLPNKTNYLEGDELETDGLVVVLTYNDGSTKETDDYTLTGYSSLPGLKMCIRDRVEWILILTGSVRADAKGVPLKD